MGYFVFIEIAAAKRRAYKKGGRNHCAAAVASNCNSSMTYLCHSKITGAGIRTLFFPFEFEICFQYTTPDDA
jgi:hypothetical protein